MDQSCGASRETPFLIALQSSRTDSQVWAAAGKAAWAAVASATPTANFRSRSYSCYSGNQGSAQNWDGRQVTISRAHAYDRTPIDQEDAHGGAVGEPDADLLGLIGLSQPLAEAVFVFDVGDFYHGGACLALVVRARRTCRLCDEGSTRPMGRFAGARCVRSRRYWSAAGVGVSSSGRSPRRLRRSQRPR